MVVNGESTVELSNSGQFLAGEAKLEFETGQITPEWDPDNAMRIDHGNLAGALSEGEGRRRDRPLHADLGREQGDDQRRGHARCAMRVASPTAWNFSLKADEAVLAVEEFGLAPMRIDEWQVAGIDCAARWARDDLALRHPLRHGLDLFRRQHPRCARLAGNSARRRAKPDVHGHAQEVLAEIPRRQCARLGAAAGRARDSCSAASSR